MYSYINKRVCVCICIYINCIHENIHITIIQALSLQTWHSVCPLPDLGGVVSGHGHHQRLFLSSLAQKVGQHERREEAELHGVAELEQLQVDRERPLKHGTQVLVVIAVLGKEDHV